MNGIYSTDSNGESIKKVKNRSIYVPWKYVELIPQKDGFILRKAEDKGIILKSDNNHAILISKALKASYDMTDDFLSVEEIKDGLFFKKPQVLPFPELPIPLPGKIETDGFQEYGVIKMEQETLLSLPFYEGISYTANFVAEEQIAVKLSPQLYGAPLCDIWDVYGRDLQMYPQKRVTFITDGKLHIPKFFRSAAAWDKGATIRVLRNGNEYILTQEKKLDARSGLPIYAEKNAGVKIHVCEKCYEQMQEREPVFQRIEAIKTVDPVTKQIRKMQVEAERIRKMIEL